MHILFGKNLQNDDHVDLVNDLVKEFDCPVYVNGELKDILENPTAYHMPSQVFTDNGKY